jgi:hypothetical protein
MPYIYIIINNNIIILMKHTTKINAQKTEAKQVCQATRQKVTRSAITRQTAHTFRFWCCLVLQITMSVISVGSCEGVTGSFVTLWASCGDNTSSISFLVNGNCVGFQNALHQVGGKRATLPYQIKEPVGVHEIMAAPGAPPGIDFSRGITAKLTVTSPSFQLPGEQHQPQQPPVTPERQQAQPQAEARKETERRSENTREPQAQKQPTVAVNEVADVIARLRKVKQESSPPPSQQPQRSTQQPKPPLQSQPQSKAQQV